jgi:hypothetical protein
MPVAKRRPMTPIPSSTGRRPDRPDRAPGSHFADAAAARKALDMALPALQTSMQDPAVCGSGTVAIVVMDPGLSPLDGDFEQAILLEQAVGITDPQRWDADYLAFARAKARLSWMSRQDSAALQATQPHRLRQGDSLLWGSVCLDGIVVGVSGAHPWWDEAFATTIAAHLRAIAKARQAEERDAGRWHAGLQNPGRG